MQENQKIINGIPIAGQWQDYWRWLPSLYMTRASICYSDDDFDGLLQPYGDV